MLGVEMLGVEMLGVEMLGVEAIFFEKLPFEKPPFEGIILEGTGKVLSGILRTVAPRDSSTAHFSAEAYNEVAIMVSASDF